MLRPTCGHAPSSDVTDFVFQNLRRTLERDCTILQDQRWVSAITTTTAAAMVQLIKTPESGGKIKQFKSSSVPP